MFYSLVRCAETITRDVGLAALAWFGREPGEAFGDIQDDGDA
jgi:hypothetical protein